MDKRALSDDLINGFIDYQYNLENPFPQPIDPHSSLKPAQVVYMSDPIFKRKVHSLVAGVMNLIDKHLD